MCDRCGRETAAGHMTRFCRKYGVQGWVGMTSIPRHYCCPDNCQFDHIDEIEADLKFWQNVSVSAPWVSNVISDDMHMLEFVRSL